MAKNRWMLSAFMVILMVATTLLAVDAQAEKVLYVGGTQSLTGPSIMTDTVSFGDHNFTFQ